MVWGPGGSLFMQFTNPPRPLPTALYEEATRVYVERVCPRARAIYRVGDFRHPGLSDIDLLVVPTGARFDNNPWFSVRLRLPRAMQAPFRSDPGIVPADAVDVLRFTTHRARILLFGEDLAVDVECVDSPEQLWSMLFERLCQFDRVARDARRRGTTDLSKLVAKARSVAYSLADIDRLTGSDRSASYCADVEELRSHFFDFKLQEAGARAWQLFDRGLASLEDALVRVLPLAPDQRPADFARSFLLGAATLPGLCAEHLAERRAAVLRAQQASRALGFRKGDVFTRTPYAERIAALNRRHRVRLPLRAVAEVAYGLRALTRDLGGAPSGPSSAEGSRSLE